MRSFMRWMAALSCVLLLGGLCGCAADPYDRQATGVTPSAPTGGEALNEWDNWWGDAPSAAAPERIYRPDEWDEALLPTEFPRPVSVTAELFTLHDKNSRLLGEPCEAWVLAVEVTASQWAALADAFADSGWSGGGTDLARTRATEIDGAWVEARHYAYVFLGDYNASSATYTVQIAVFLRHATRSLDDLTANFPAFTAGYSHTGGERTDDSETDEIRWVFGGAGRFVGVSDAAVAAYQQELADSGFAVSVRDEGTHCVAERQTEQTAYQAEALFDPDCRTLELIYTVHAVQA